MASIIFGYFISLVIGFPLLILFVLLLLEPYSNSKLFCDKMGWHKDPINGITNDGCSDHGECPRCRKKVMKDGQGNWF